MQAVVDFTQQIQFIGVPSGCGAKDERCALGPDAVLSANIQQQLSALGYDSHWHMLEEASHHDDASKNISNVCQKLAFQTQVAVENNQPFVVVGGDHSCAIGSWSGVAAAHQPFGLIWIDAHLDSHTHETTPSQAIHGMPVASLLGYGQKSLTHLPGPFPKLNPEHIILIGVRSFEDQEWTLLQSQGVRVVFMDELEKRGFADVLKDAMRIVTHGTKGFGISIDLDAIDPLDAPGVGSPEAGGIRANCLLSGLQGISHVPGFLGLEIAELNPIVDKNNKTVELTCELIKAVFKGVSS